MLIATSYRDFDVKNKSPPKVISEVRKTYLNCAGPNLRPKLTGELFIKTPQDQYWHRRRTQIRGGQLHVSPVTPFNEDLPPLTAIKLPLRHLSLQAGPLPHSLILCKGQNVVLMLQTDTEEIFDEWVKTIAIELIRQTPLDAIKYLDILTLAECYNKTNQRNEQNYVICPQTYQKIDVCTDSETPCQRLHNSIEFEGTNRTSANVAFRNENNIQNELNLGISNQSGHPKTEKLKDLNQNSTKILHRTSPSLSKPNDRLNPEKLKTCIQNNPNGSLSKPLEQNGEHISGQHSNVLSENEYKESNLKKDCNQNILVDQVDSPKKPECEACTFSQDRCKKKLPQPDSTPTQPTDQEKLVESLLRKCQNSESYVPVKEKLVLFESLCKMGRKVRSTEDVSLKPETSNTKRAKSLHDLSSINTHIAVREICKYFENKGDNLGTTENKNVEKNSDVKRLKFKKCNANSENLYKFHRVIVIS